MRVKHREWQSPDKQIARSAFIEKELRAYTYMMKSSCVLMIKTCVVLPLYIYTMLKIKGRKMRISTECLPLNGLSLACLCLKRYYLKFKTNCSHWNVTLPKFIFFFFCIYTHELSDRLSRKLRLIEQTHVWRRNLLWKPSPYNVYSLLRRNE